MITKKPNFSRRQFLRKLAFTQNPGAAKVADRTLVCIFLRGGADTLNMLVPYGDDEYRRQRPTLSIAPPSDAADSAIRLDDFYGLHPRLAPIVPLYKEGRFGFVQAVGADNTSGSHFEVQDQVEHGESAAQNAGGGWLGRYLRTRGIGANSPLSAVAIGPTLPESLRGAPSATALRSLDEVHLPVTGEQSHAVARALSQLYGAEVGLIGQQGARTLDLLDRVERLRGAPYTPAPGADYPKDDFAAGLREVARIIKARVGLEVASVDLGGWDTHFIQGAASGILASQIDLLAKSLAAFDADLVDHRDSVTTIIMTEFGRRLYENTSAGTDHGRGYAFMAMGANIAGGKVHGAYPGLGEDEPDFLGPGGMRMNHDYRSVLAEVLTNAMGARGIDQVFPEFSPKSVGIAPATM